MKPLMQVGEVSDAIRVSPATVTRLTRTGALPGVRVSPRRWAWRPEDVEEYVKSRIC
ncbi:helix-turn-helix transcriptional regulator [Gordonia sp. NPDC062954]|uniref:helix-turn-helix transcriptional regulator n=1 Tax=Gordonia sp. NPDC062954 TaxID=3364003 RepID=UPI0037C56BF5